MSLPPAVPPSDVSGETGVSASTRAALQANARAETGRFGIAVSLGGAIILLAAAGLVVYIVMRHGTLPDQLAEITARSGSLIEIIHSDGQLEPLNETPISTRIRATIVYIPREGQAVKKGDLLLQMDETDLVQRRNDRIDIIDRDMAGLKQLIQNRLKDRVRAVMDQELQAWQAELERMKLRDIDLPDTNSVISAQQNYIFAQKNLEACHRELELLEQKSVAASIRGQELDLKRLAEQEAFIQLVKSRIALERVQLGATPVDRRAQELSAENNRVQLEKMQERERMAVAQQEQGINNTRFGIFNNIRRLERYNRDIQKMFIFSPQDGIVNLKNRWGNPWSAGQKTYDGATPLSLPNAGGLKAVTRIADTTGLSVGMPVLVCSPASGTRLMAGKILKISNQGKDEFDHFANETRDKLLGNADRIVYEVEVEVFNPPPVLRNGLNCDVFFIRIPDEEKRRLAVADPSGFVQCVTGAQPDDALVFLQTHAKQLGGASGVIIPRGALRRTENGGVDYVIILDKNRFVARRVAVSAVSLREALISDGIEAGERIYLGPSRGVQIDGIKKIMAEAAGEASAQ